MSGDDDIGGITRGTRSVRFTSSDGMRVACVHHGGVLEEGFIPCWAPWRYPTTAGTHKGEGHGLFSVGKMAFVCVRVCARVSERGGGVSRCLNLFSVIRKESAW